MSESSSLTKALYYTELARIYMEDFKRECKLEAKHQASSWVNKLTFVKQDVYSALTPLSRELYHKELGDGADVLFLPSISEKLLKLNQDQRDFVERTCDFLLSGEEIILEQIPPK